VAKQLPPPGAKNEGGDKSDRRILPREWLVAITAVITVGGTLLGVAYVTNHDSASASTPTSAAASLSVSTLSTTAANTVSPQKKNNNPLQPIAGTIHGTLKNGQTIFATWRALYEPGDPLTLRSPSGNSGDTQYFVYSGLPRTITGDAFTCNPATLGGEPDSKVSAIWVGIADSGATKAFVNSYYLENVPNTANASSGPQPAPPGYDVGKTAFRIGWVPAKP
jgi:hypothetical protein